MFIFLVTLVYLDNIFLCKEVIFKMKYEMSCDDGFMVQSKSKDEAASMAAWHIMMNHPKERMSMSDVMKNVKVAKEM
jgi:hypothetical protein